MRGTRPDGGKSRLKSKQTDKPRLTDLQPSPGQSFFLGALSGRGAVRLAGCPDT